MQYELSPPKKEDLQEQRRRLNDMAALARSYKRLFDGPDGELVLRDILKSGYVYDPTYSKGQPTDQTMLNEGMRTLAMHILKQIHRDDSRIYGAIDKLNIEIRDDKNSIHA